MTVSGSRVVALLLALVAGGLVLAFWPRASPAVPEAIERQVVEMTRAAEHRELGTLMEAVSEHFRSEEGWDKQEVKGVVAAHILRGQWVRVFTTGLTITEVSSTRGDFQAKFIFGRSPADKVEELVRQSVLSAYLIEGTFEREEDGVWRVVRARHRPLSPSELL
jgi:hypothetical protein